MGGKSGPKLNDIERAEIVARVRKGESKASVAKSLQVSRQTVTALCNSRIAAKHSEIVQELRVNAELHALDDKDAAITALLEDAADLRAMNMDDYVTIQTVIHRSYDKDGTISDEWKREEPCLDWKKAQDAGVLKRVKKFAVKKDGSMSFELFDRCIAASNIEKVANMRGWIVARTELSGSVEVTSKVYVGKAPADLLPKPDANRSHD